MLLIPLFVMVIGFGDHASGSTANVKSYYVDASAGVIGDGSAKTPFQTIQEGMNAAQPGDIVWVAVGEYSDLMQTVRDGEERRPITIRSYPPVQVPYGAVPGWTPGDESKRVWIRREGRGIDIQHSNIVIDGINVDGLWHGNAFVDEEGIFRDTTTTGEWVSSTNGIVLISRDSKSIVLRNMEVKNNQNTLIRVHGDDIVIDNARIHGGIARVNNTPAPAPHTGTHQSAFNDAHGIVVTFSHGLTITNTYIGNVSGDNVQYGRSVWGDFLVENSHFEMAPLAESVLGLEVGTWIGEDHFDTKTPGRNDTDVEFNSGVTFRNNILNGTRYSRILNGAVLNLKEGVENIIVEGNLIYDNRLAFRLRRPTREYVIRNNVFYDNDDAIWFAGSMDDIQIINNTFYDNESTIRGRSISNAIIAANIFMGQNQINLDEPKIHWQHNLYYQDSSELQKTVDATGLIADPLFVDPGNGDFRLHPDSPALPLGIGARPIR